MGSPEPDRPNRPFIVAGFRCKETFSRMFAPSFDTTFKPTSLTSFDVAAEANDTLSLLSLCSFHFCFFPFLNDNKRYNSGLSHATAIEHTKSQLGTVGIGVLNDDMA